MLMVDDAGPVSRLTNAALSLWRNSSPGLGLGWSFSTSKQLHRQLWKSRHIECINWDNKYKQAKKHNKWSSSVYTFQYVGVA